MSLRLLHRRLAIAMGFAGLLAFAGGAGFEPVSALLATAALVIAWVWQPDRALSGRLERVWLPIAALLVLRALVHVFVFRDDVVIPVVDLLLLLMAAEALRSLEARNDVRLYALSFALLLASTAYRPGVLFLVAFVVYVFVASLALMVGHLRRRAERHGVREVPIARGLVVTTAALSGVVLVVSLLVFLTFPRVSRGWASRGETLATSIAGFSDRISIGEHGSRIYPNPAIVLRVEFPDGMPDNLLGLRWRGRSYDRFDGVLWTRSRGLPASSAPVQWYRERWDGPLLQQKIYGAPLDVRVLFAIHPTVSIEPEPGTQPLFDNAGDLVYWGSGAPAYTAWSVAESPADSLLRTAAGGYLPGGGRYLQLPRLDPRIPALADSLTQGLASRFDRVVAIERWLRAYDYTLELPRTASEATLEHFLFERRAGHCEYFSTAMVVLLRAAGIESRNVNGFLGGEWSTFGNYLAVTQNQAHSWVEVWFPGFGWVPFDPTPGGGGVGAGGTAWFWPGRFLFDALQHRWGKWVLDYSLDTQSDLLGRWAGLLDGSRPDPIAPAGEGRALPRGWGLALLLAAAGGGLWALRRGGGRRPPETRAYLRLRRACERHGVPVDPGLTPLALVRRVRQRRPRAGGAAERVVDLYLRARYGRESLGTSELRALREALGAASRDLRIRTRTPSSLN